MVQVFVLQIQTGAMELTQAHFNWRCCMEHFLLALTSLKHDSNDGEIRLRTKVAGTNTDVVTIVDGNVGINDTAPSEK